MGNLTRISIYNNQKVLKFRQIQGTVAVAHDKLAEQGSHKKHNIPAQTVPGNLNLPVAVDNAENLNLPNIDDGNMEDKETMNEPNTSNEVHEVNTSSAAKPSDEESVLGPMITSRWTPSGGQKIYDRQASPRQSDRKVSKKVEGRSLHDPYPEKRRQPSRAAGGNPVPEPSQQNPPRSPPRRAQSPEGPPPPPDRIALLEGQVQRLTELLMGFLDRQHQQAQHSRVEERHEPPREEESYRWDENPQRPRQDDGQGEAAESFDLSFVQQRQERRLRQLEEEMVALKPKTGEAQGPRIN
ncbi:uncharacterized protein LOC127793129 [Diospyros lotus]|uniref:uncharacterized protein LOC127793129 n=1 Tax=Diospyros lotus TaxID=55363 RepID=UPI00225B3EC7|nr:uncharacterized protein LOC127793129 [Diospyros lotus]